MVGEVKTVIQLAIGHALFIDIVGYSKLPINEQSEQIHKFKEMCSPVSRNSSWAPDRGRVGFD